jgi:hypothetical protein
MVPGTTTGWNYEVFESTMEGATYQRMEFIPTIDEAMRLYYKLTIRKAQRVAGAVLAQTANGLDLTYVNPIGTAVTLSPVGSTVPMVWSENEDAETDFNLDRETAGEGEQALAELTESNALANVASLTNIIGQANVDAAMLRRGIGTLIGLTNGTAEPGGTPAVHGIFSNVQYPNLVAIPEVNSAEARGDSENPYVRGIWVKGFGFNLHLSTVVYQDANGWHNCLYVPSAFVISWNVRSRVKRQDEELANRVILYNNVGSGVKHNDRAIDMRTTANALE